MSGNIARECPEPLRRAFLELLRDTLLHIRAESTNSELCLALSDHMHNVPSLLSDFSADKLEYYWATERLCFVRVLCALGRQPPAIFIEPWKVIESEHRRLCASRIA